MSLDKRGPEAMRAAVRRLMAAIQRPEVNVTVRRRDVEILLLRHHGNTVEMPNLHPNQQ